jgi:ATP-dependent Lon protease
MKNPPSKKKAAKPAKASKPTKASKVASSEAASVKVVEVGAATETSSSGAGSVVTKPPGNAAAGGIPGRLAIIPIRHAVLFPGMTLPLSIGRSNSRKLLAEVLPNTAYVGVFSQRHDTEDEPNSKDLYKVGVVAKVKAQPKNEDGTTTVIVEVLERVSLDREVEMKPYLVADTSVIHSRLPVLRTEEEKIGWDAKVAALRENAEDYLRQRPDVPEQTANFMKNIEDQSRLLDFIAGGLEFTTSEKQNLLEELEVTQRLEVIQAKLAHQLHVMELQDKIQKDVHDTFTDQQRRAYLQEQIRAIQKELGDGNAESEDTITKLRAKLEKAQPNQIAKDQAEREMKRLSQVSPASGEFHIISTYVETIASLPWNVSSEDNLDLDRAQAVLDDDHYGLDKVKRRIIEHLAVRKLRKDGHAPILLLAGPPGVGKTSLGKSIAKSLGRKFIRLSLGGTRDVADIRGHRRTYVGAVPGRLIEEIRRAGTNNPVILLDEIDKVGRDHHGDPTSALLEVLDPHQNHSFTDHYLDVPFDLSKVLFLATANDLGRIPGPLRDRMETLELSSYTEREKREIAKRYIAPRQIEENGLTKQDVAISASAINTLIQDYTREAGVRELERQVGSVCRAVAAQVARTKKRKRKKVSVDQDFVRTALGPARYEYDERNRQNLPGVVTGLAWTSVGGEILSIEALKYAGSNHTKLTGHLGDVMKESVSAALSLVRSHAKELNIAADAFKETDIHIHVPAGAVPKDGPSAGVAMFTALASLFSGRSVRADVGMTGEISLRGLVLPIGGLKEKSLAALRAGLKTVVAPVGNKKDLPDIPEEVRKGLNFVWAKTVEDVLAVALK